MTNINWNDVDSLELFNPKTGKTLPVAPNMEYWPNEFGDYWLATATPCGHFIFGADGTRRDDECDWIIRTKLEAHPLPEPVLAYLRERAADGDEEAVKLLPMDDRLMAIAMEIVLLDGAARTDPQKRAILKGLAGQHKVGIALAGIKRGIELAKGERDDD